MLDFNLDPYLQPLVDAARDYAARADFVEQWRRGQMLRLDARGDGYSLARLIQASSNDLIQRDAPREFDESQRLAEAIGRQPRPGFAFVPVAARDLNTAVANQGGNLVAGMPDAAPQDTYVAALRASGLARRFGLRRVPVTGNPSFPRITTAASTTWLASETASIAEAQPVIGSVSATPKTVGARFDISRMLLKQVTLAGERFLFGEAGAAVAAAVDGAVVAGSGASGQPQGVIGTSGVATQSGTSLNWAGVCNAVEQVETASAMVEPAAVGWVIGAAAAELLRVREKATGSGFILDDGRIAGYPAFVSNVAPATGAVFGDWSGVMLPEWGVLEVGADPFTQFTSGVVTVRALWALDVAVLRPSSFCTISNIT